ncbi:hypothetical protein CEUSTIGMA_g13868.t1 [Chlamydomonas eustigma]|uniref:Helitron helicase-like domain-containing protein n=1 Tax=Chlamydomonas eustigma TaxID=1157962 RepID=A0A250XTS6_9CHLO|nr:hypothetical protein CEUSTIGMA_g13868.t1 [Chlamydomonas eustigma]|eukprot:GAX86458.1 hypothetical protein CEUSTIGMA_g13868.t1 [Chlamydomonas eustigma]
MLNELKAVWDGNGLNAISYSEFQHLIAVATTIPTNQCSWADGKKYTLTLPTAASTSEMKRHEHGCDSSNDEVIPNVTTALIDMVMIIVVSKEVLGKAVLDREETDLMSEALEVPTLNRDLEASQSNAGVDDDCCDDNRISEAAGCSALTDRMLSSGMASTSGHNTPQKQDHVHHELRRSGRKRRPTGRYATSESTAIEVGSVYPVGQQCTKAGEQDMADSERVDTDVDVGKFRNASASSSGNDSVYKPSTSRHPKGLPPLVLQQLHPRAGERSKKQGERPGPEDVIFSEQFRAKFEQWRLDEAIMIPGMMCCSFCGKTAFGGQLMSKDTNFTLCNPTQNLPEPPYFFGNQVMREYMVRKDAAGVEKWLQCSSCKSDKAQRRRLHHVVQCSPAYQQALLSTHPLVVQTTSVTDVSVNMLDRVCGHVKGEVRTDSVLMSAPLISRGPLLPTHVAPGAAEMTDHNLKLLLGTLKQSNALVQQCYTLAEKSLPGTHGLPMLPPESIAAIAEDFRSGAPVFDNGGMEVCVMPEVFSLVATCDAQPQPVVQAPTGFKVGSVKLRASGEDLDVVTNSSGLPLHLSRKRGRCMLEDDDGSNADGKDDEAAIEMNKPVLERLTLELAVFCVLFPHAMGYFKGDTRLGDYLFYRMSCSFSNFTLYKPYLMLMFLVRQCNMLHSQCGKGVLEKDMAAFRKRHPEQNEEEAVRHAMKHVLPATIPGSPAWHYNALQDLLAVVNENGMPDLFWTVTMDEVSELKWQPVKDMEVLLKKFCQSMSFKDAPVECARLFDEKLQRAIKQWLFIKGGKVKGVLGRIKDYLIRYEVQDRGSVHAHVIFWLHDEDVEAACSKIRSCMPAAWDEEADAFVRPASDPLAAVLFDIVNRKQRHVCTAVGAPGCRRDSPKCNGHFPQPQQLGYAPQRLDDNHWHCYFCPRGGVDGPDRNIGPYIPELTMVMNSHQNMQKIMDTSWSFYLLKYAMKAEASSHLNIDPNMVTRLGLEGLSEAQCQVATATWMTKPVVATEAAMILLRIKMVQGSRQVISINTAPPSIRMKRMSRGNNLCMAPVDKYMARPVEMENLTMTQYLRQYHVSQSQGWVSCIPVTGVGIMYPSHRGGYRVSQSQGWVSCIPVTGVGIMYPSHRGGYHVSQSHVKGWVSCIPVTGVGIMYPSHRGGYHVSQSHVKGSAHLLAGKDSRGGYVYKLEAGTLVRFSDYNPKYSSEGFFYNLLVSKVPFRDEATLMPPQ